MASNQWGGRRAGAGRNALYKNKRAINLKLTEEAIEIITDKASAENISRSDYLNRLILDNK